MQFIKPDVNIDFIGKRKIAFYCSLFLLFVSLATLLVHKGPRYGIDFAGGTLIQIQFSEAVEIAQIKEGLTQLDLDKSSVQRFGEAADNEYLIRTSKSGITGEDFSDRLGTALSESTGLTPEVRRVEMVGPKVGKDLREKALFAMFYALLFITIYISGRFELKWMPAAVMAFSLMGAVSLLAKFQVGIPFLILAALVVSLVLFWYLKFKYAMGAIVALIHDVTITVGLFSILGKEFTLPIIAALLTIIGYSLNDTIIVFDRIRENQKKMSKSPLDGIINRSINETLSRTILTSLTTLTVVVTLFLLGGGIIHDFAFAMIVGVLIGTYSSVFVASPILLAWNGNEA